MRPPARALLTLILAVSLPVTWATPGRGGDSRQVQQLTPAQAGEIARRQSGGRVLAVKPANGGYQVKVLTPAGEVRYVFVSGSGR